MVLKVITNKTKIINEVRDWVEKSIILMYSHTGEILFLRSFKILNYDN